MKVSWWASTYSFRCLFLLMQDLASLLSIFADSAQREVAERFSLRCGIPFCKHDSWQQADTPYVMVYAESCVSLVQTGKGAPGPVSASFLGGKNVHRLKFGGGKGQLIAKAVGLKSGVIPHVLDCTAGLGRDAFVLASLGCRMTLLERSPVVAELLSSALDEARESELAEIVERMCLFNADAIDWLATYAGDAPDVIYLDPMYPHREKSSQVKKEMRLFHDLVGQDQDDAALLARALETARCRVVVKRPRKGSAIEGQTPSFQLQGKSCRYDIYTKASLSSLKAS